MKAMVLIEPGRMELGEAPEPVVGPEEVLIEVCYVGLCGSDLNAYRGRSPMVTYPRVMGHEVGGRIAAAGRTAPAHLRPGTKVTLSPYSHCGACLACRTGRTNACVSNQTLGVQREGALTERIAVHHSTVYASEVLSLRELALVEPLSVGAHAVTRGRVEASDSVAVFGCGAVGLGAITAAAGTGATVIAVDIDDAKLAAAGRLGAGHAVNTAREGLAARVEEITGGEGVSVAIEAVGAPATYQAAVQVAATGGRVVCIGYSDRVVELDTRLIVKKELELLGSRNAKTEFASVIRAMERRDRPYAEMITRVIPFEAAGQAFAEWSAAPQEVTRILVEVGEGRG